jgi:spore maturation protein SpmB
LDYFLPAILALEDTTEVDRAAKTKLLRHILDKELGSRATLTMAFFDLFFLLMLLISFQIMVYNVVEGGGYTAKFVVATYLSMTGVIYSILRKFGQMSSMIKISKQAFVENNFRWEDAVDWIAILLSIGGIVWMEMQTTLGFVELTDFMRSYLAAAICALWFKLVSWLSVINWQVVNLVQVLQQVSNKSVPFESQMIEIELIMRLSLFQ